MKIKTIKYHSIRRLNVDYTSPFEEVNVSDVNVFIGENGSGKSTVIDMIRALKDTRIIPSLAKENPLSGTNPCFFIEFIDGRSLTYVFSTAKKTHKSKNKYLSFQLIFNKEYSVFNDDLHKFDYSKNEGLLSGILLEGIEVNYKYCDSKMKDKKITAGFVGELNRIEKYLNGALDRKNNSFKAKNQNALIYRRDGNVDVWLQEDIDMANIIPAEWFPSGWRAYADVTSWLNSCSPDSICLIEEPEVNLHPKLQRLLLRRIIEISKDKNIQIFFSTHSPTLINGAVDGELKLFHTRGNLIEELNDHHHLLDELGFKASDLLQSNCIVWVEGPSDRIYLNYWLKNKGMNFVEGEDYSIMFYGGRLLSHLTTIEQSDVQNEFISLLKMNRNTAIIIDSDKANHQDVINQTKRRISERFYEDNSFCWVTEGREIENYLNVNSLEESVIATHPSAIRLASKGKWDNLLHFYKADGALNKRANKVLVAKHYINNVEADYSVSDLDVRMKELCDFILISKC